MTETTPKPELSADDVEFIFEVLSAPGLNVPLAIAKRAARVMDTVTALREHLKTAPKGENTEGTN